MLARHAPHRISSHPPLPCPEMRMIAQKWFRNKARVMTQRSLVRARWPPAFNHPGNRNRRQHLGHAAGRCPSEQQLPLHARGGSDTSHARGMEKTKTKTDTAPADKKSHI